MKNHGGPAFPLKCNVETVSDSEGCPSGFVIEHLQEHQGMSLRDYFAGQALSGICSCASDNGTPRTTPEWAAALAYEVADAMLAKREEKR